MLLRVFTRITAEQVRPNDVIERPRPMVVTEVHNRVDGLRIWGYRPGSGPGSKSPRVSLDIDPKANVDLPCTAPATVASFIQSLLDARRAADKDDDVVGGLEWSWDPGEGVFTVTAQELDAPLQIGFADDPEPAPAPEKTKPAAKTTKAVKTTAPSTPEDPPA